VLLEWRTRSARVGGPRRAGAATAGIEGPWSPWLRVECWPRKTAGMPIQAAGYHEPAAWSAKRRQRFPTYRPQRATDRRL